MKPNRKLRRTKKCNESKKLKRLKSMVLIRQREEKRETADVDEA